MSNLFRKKLIEVALPLEAINVASAREKSIRHGHPSTLHLWWARRPLAAARAVIFSQMVDDPSEYVQELVSPGTESRKAAERALRKQLAAWEARSTEKADEKKPTLEGVAIETERQRLFRLIEELVKWENTTNEEVIQRARDEIWRSWRRTCADNADHPRAKELFDRDKLPAFHDPFAGGGALPLEAQRLGLEAYASDLNPVAVLINKAMIEIPPKFAGMPPVNPDAQAKKDLSTWKGAQGLAEDVRYYGQWMRDEAERRIGHLYPKVPVTKERVAERPDLKPYEGRELTVIAWLWARTVKSPNPAFRDVHVPLASTFMLSTKEGKEAYVEVVREEEREARMSDPLTPHSSPLSPRPYRFIVKVGKPKDAEAARNGTKAGGRGANFLCVMSGTPLSGDYIKAEGKAGRMGERLMAIVAEGDRGRVYLAPTQEHEAAALKAKPTWRPEGDIATRMTGGNCTPYGLTTWGDLFTPRQLVALTTFSDLVQEARERVKHDAEIALRTQDLGPSVPGSEASARSYVLNATPLSQGGTGAAAYSDAVAVYLAFALSKQADLGNSLCRWEPVAQCPRQLFGRQAIPMIWDFAEGNPLGDSSGAWVVFVDGIAKAFAKTFAFVPARAVGYASQADAGRQEVSSAKVVSTDPPYYDNIGYADLSDFFYSWLRRSLKSVFPQLFGTLAVPKAEELVATPYRHGSKEMAETFFLDGMTQAMRRLAEQGHPAVPVTIFYARKQAESHGADGTTNTGWDTFLAAVIAAGFAISGTWPMRTENDSRMIGQGTNALASSIILVCRRRESDAPTATRRELLSALQKQLPKAIADLQRGNIAPVDLQQAAIGPGMAIYTQYAQVLDADGKPLTVRQALAMIHRSLDEVLAEQEGDFDADTRWALTWFEQYGFAEGEYGIAEVLSKAKATSVQGVVDAGIAVSGKGKVRLLRPEELPTDWTPGGDKRLTVWDMVHHLIRVLDQGERSAADLLADLGPQAEVARELAYRLYAICDRTKRSQDAQRYNALVQSWPEIVRLAQSSPTPSAKDQSQLEFGP